MIQPGDTVHYESPNCPGDQYRKVLEVSPDGQWVKVEWLGIGRWISVGSIVSVVKPNPDPTPLPSSIIDIGRIRTKL